MLALALAAAYATSFQGAFVFDDLPAIVENPTIRNLARLSEVFSLTGAHGGTIDGRPVLNFTLALNYAISGTNPWSYHALNLAIHVSATLVLWGVLRRTFACVGGTGSPAVRPPSVERAAGDADATPTVLRGAASAPMPVRPENLSGLRPALVAFAIALLWGIHPLQTQAVTYVVQRAESLAGLCFLLTLYCFSRAVVSPAPTRWKVCAFLACAAGMASKEIMVSAPLIVLLYDRTFVARSWREALRRRSGLHGALFSTWILLFVLVWSTQGRGGTAGFRTGIEWWAYALTQCRAIVHYLGLALWPHPLVFDYGIGVERDPTAVALPLLVLALLLGGTVWALARRPATGFLGAWFFFVLAPSSSFVPVATQTMAEHRMYLALAAVLTGLYVLAQRIVGRAAVVAFVALAIAAGGLTAARNRAYHTELALWKDTVAKRPENARARTNLGIALLDAGRIEEAIVHYQRSLAIDPQNAATHVNLCGALRRVGRPRDAVPHGEAALRLEPDYPNAHVNLALALADTGEPAAAIRHFERALTLQPGARDVHLGLAAALVAAGRNSQAIVHYRSALELGPDDAHAWCDLARAFAQERDFASARSAAERALQLKPDFPDACYVLGTLAVAREDFASALTYFRRALDLAPEYVAARNNLANVLLMGGRFDEAIEEYRAVLRARPDDASVQENLARALELQRARRPR